MTGDDARSTNVPTISVVIPAWNEGAWLERTLRSIEANVRPLEIIVADNHSADATAAVARSHGCLVVMGGRPGAGRNAGARVARGDVIFFIDADVVVPRDVVPAVLRALDQRGLVGATLRTVPITDRATHALSYRLHHWYLRACDLARRPHGVGSFMAVRRLAFEAEGGFDEALQAGEDSEFWERLKRVGPVAYIASSHVYVSPRRFLLERPSSYARRCVWHGILGCLGVGEAHFTYLWKPYPSSIATRELALWGETEASDEILARSTLRL